ncbi:hypothetical protein SLEP1_g54269 [Rubroshorea leprosula]|uniref:Retrotransposon gag domain-containing protein n=1 Tax=Rubroshorea leprosula TaxID=152421 RepID=A0AAV5MEC3_9ROSI|nr:hypothetical protein SLEP1_g54269 [Rubroshorea leprosula]
MATFALTLGNEPMSSCPPNPTIIGASGTKPFVLNAGVATVQSNENDQVETQVVKSTIKDEDKAIKVKVQLMEETLKSMLGVQANKLVDISFSCLFPNIQLPHKFKLPKFDKYNGTGCPYAHLTMYYRKMASYANDEKLMIHYFHDSLIGPTDAWFSTLDKRRVKSWHDLTYNFMKQYEYNTSLAPSREDLQKTEKKSSESFKEFAQRWRGLVARVKPPLTDHELTGLVTSVPMVPLNPPFPTWYNPQARCEYHSGGIRHDLGLSCFEALNPLPTHDGSTVNIIEKDFEEGQEVAAVTLTNQVSSTPR